MITFDQFVQYAVQSRLVDSQRWGELVRAVQAGAPSGESDATRLMRLVELAERQGLLTMWQCSKLLEGRYKGFFLGKYKLVEFIATGNATSRYLAETDSQQRVEIFVTPPGRGSFVVASCGSFIEDDFVEP